MFFQYKGFATTYTVFMFQFKGIDFFVNYDITTKYVSLTEKKPFSKLVFIEYALGESVEDPGFCQIRIQGSVSRTKEDLKYLRVIMNAYFVPHFWYLMFHWSEHQPGSGSRALGR